MGERREAEEDRATASSRNAEAEKLRAQAPRIVESIERMKNEVNALLAHQRTRAKRSSRPTRCSTAYPHAVPEWGAAGKSEKAEGEDIIPHYSIYITRGLVHPAVYDAERNRALKRTEKRTLETY